MTKCKMNKKIILCICILLSIGLVIAVECQDETDVSDIPCDMITPILVDCTAFTYNVTEVATGLLQQNGTLTSIGDGTYKFSFTPGRGIYNVFTCENNTFSGTISVGDFATQVNVKDWGILFILILGWLGLIIGLIFKEDTFVMIAAILLLITGIWIINNGFFNLTGYIIEWFAIIQILIGVYILIKWSWMQYQDM